MELPITQEGLEWSPAGSGGADTWRWKVELEEGDETMTLRVDLSNMERMALPISDTALRYAFLEAVQRYAAGRLRVDGRPVLEQVREWESPVVLKSDYFQIGA